MKCCWDRFLLLFKPRNRIKSISLDDSDEYEYKVYFSDGKRSNHINIEVDSPLNCSELSISQSSLEYLNMDNVTSDNFKSASCSNLPDNKKNIDVEKYYSML